MIKRMKKKKVAFDKKGMKLQSMFSFYFFRFIQEIKIMLDSLIDCIITKI